jgi:hypothetical protein
MPAPPLAFARDSPLVQKLELSSSRAAMPYGFFCTDSRMRSVRLVEMRKAGPKTAVI